MSVILGSERALFDRHIVEVNLDVDDFETTKERRTRDHKADWYGQGHGDL